LLRVQKVTQGLPVLLSIRAHVDCRLVAWDGAATVGDRGTVRPVLAGRAAAGRHGTGATLLRTRTAQPTATNPSRVPCLPPPRHGATPTYGWVRSVVGGNWERAGG